MWRTNQASVTKAYSPLLGPGTRPFRRYHPRRVLALLATCAWVGAPVASATQVCTTQDLGNTEFRGISGSGDLDVIAVGKSGTIQHWDGATWSAMASPTGEDLNDVEMVSSTVAFAVGKQGTILQLVGGAWVEHASVTNKEFQGVWAASASEAWAVGMNSTLLAWDGVSWSDQSGAAGTGGEELTDAWGDAGSAYVLGAKGVLYRYDRSAGAWDPPETACEGGAGFEDLWGDANGNLYLVKKKEVYLYDGVACTLETTAGENLAGVHGWTGNGRVYAVGKKGTVLELDSGVWTETQEAADDFLDVWVSGSGNAYYAGKKGELTTCVCSNCNVIGFLVVHDAFGIHCLNEAVRVDVIDVASGDPVTDYSGQITLDTQTGFGTWSLAAGSGAFADAVANDGLATYDWPLGESSATFTLDYQEGPELFDIDAYATADPTTRDDDSEGMIAFSASGFTLTAAPLSNPPPAVIPPFAGPEIAGTDFALHLAAFGQTPNDPECGIIETYTGAKSLKFWSSYLNPLAGILPVSIDGFPIAASEAAAGPQGVVFTNGQAAVTGKYKDVGSIQIQVKDDTMAHPDLPNGIRGATAAFVVKPDQFLLSSIEDSGGNPNPGAADANGPVFTAAGQPISVTVTALDAEGDPTPSYGLESVPETVQLSSALIAPLAGNNPPITAAVGFGPFSGGSATGTDFLWPEVGIISLVPSVGDGSYLGAGDVSGLASGNVGRFIPDHFTDLLNVPQFGTACGPGGFTYLGESFDYTQQPVISLTARAATSTVTQNYTGAFFKLDNTALLNRTYAAITGTLDLSGVPPPAADPVVADLGAGLASLTFSSGTGLSFVRGLPVAGFDAEISLSIDVFDTDGAAALGNPVTFGSPGGIAFDAGRSIRYGRARMLNALGSELVDLAVPMRAEQFLDTATGFVTHTADNCTGAVSLSLGGYTSALDPGETCVQDIGFPGDSGAGCAAPGPPPEQYQEPPAGGDFNLYLAAPGAGNQGSVTVTGDVPAWLEFDWDAAAPGLEDPDGTATFGIFAGNERRIYVREVY